MCARAMQARREKLAEDEYEEFKFDKRTYRVRCAGHKVALVVNGGLQALGIEAPLPPLVKSTILGEFPLNDHRMTTITEEDEDPQSTHAQKSQPDQGDCTVTVSEEDNTDLSNIPGTVVDNQWYQVIDRQFDSLPDIKRPATNCNEANAVYELTLKVLKFHF